MNKLFQLDISNPRPIPFLSSLCDLKYTIHKYIFSGKCTK